MDLSDVRSDSDGEDEDSPGHRWAGVNAQVLLLDVSDGGAPAAFESCLELLRHMMANAPKQLVGVALFGTRSNDGAGLENVVRLLELREPSIEGLRSLRRLCDEPGYARATWGATDSYNLGDAFWLATRMFSNCNKTMNLRRVTVLSRFAEPDPASHRAILKKASDLRSLGIEVNLVNVSEERLPDGGFLSRLLDVLEDVSDDGRALPEPCNSVEQILPLIRQTGHAKRASARIKMELGPDLKIGVGLYHLCRPRSLPKKLALHGETNEEVTVVHQTVVGPMSFGTQSLGTPSLRTPSLGTPSLGTPSPETPDEAPPARTRPALQAEIAMYQTYGGKRIELTAEELGRLKKFGGAPRIRLLGFKPKSALSMSKWYLKVCSFLYPDEAAVAGSTALLRCLRDRCAAKERVAICVLVSRWYSHPRLVALVPQSGVVQNGRQIVPDGFHVIHIPFAENFRNLDIEENAEITAEQETCMKKIIKKLKIEYTCDNFENPKLQTFYSALEALALDEGEQREVVDTTQPDSEMQRIRIGGLADDFKAHFGPFGASPQKRKNAEDREAKKRAPPKTVDCPDVPTLAARIEEEKVNKYTVPELKQILLWYKPENLPGLTGLKKERLVELVYSCCRNMFK